MEKDVAWLLKEKYHGEKTDCFFADCARLQAGEPLAYIIGHTPFLDCTIFLDSYPLIPRVETEFWVEQAIMRIKGGLDQASRKASPKCLEGDADSCLKQASFNSNQLNILDLCAGSGCIGVAVARAIPEASVDFAELDPTHLPTITKNLHHNAPQARLHPERYQVLASDVFAAVSGTYDVILTNPPYIDPALDRTDPAVREFEPATALYGGKDGMEVITACIAGARTHLHPNGALWIEHEPEQSLLIAAQASKHGFTCTTHQDQYQVERYSILVLQ